MEIGAVVLALIVIAGAALAFVILKKVLKMAIRAIVVFLIFSIAIAGGIAFYMFGKTGETTPRTTTNKTAR